MKKILLYLLVLLPFTLFGQFPTAIGTAWQYVQYTEDLVWPVNQLPAFSDLIQKDTLIAGNTYQKVRRYGTVRFESYNFAYDQPIAGVYFMRVDGNRVLILDSLSQGLPAERLFLDLGLSDGDTLSEIPKSHIGLTTMGAAAYGFDYGLYCDSVVCDSYFVQTSYAYNSTWRVAGSTYNPYQTIVFDPRYGVLWGGPYPTFSHGLSYVLKELRQGGNTLYTNPLFLTGVDANQNTAFMQVAPNPATDKLMVIAKEPMWSISVVNATGSTVISHAFDGLSMQKAIDVSNLPRGLYWVVVQGESERATQAVVLR